MRWDDLRLLRQIDECEESEQTGPLSNGSTLMQATSQGKTIDWGRDERTFARELLLARAAGYLEWIDPFNPGVHPADPIIDAQRWLQEIRDISLTLPGRDRARGRVIQRPLPDPDEDDDRPITGMTLEDIARAIGDTYTAPQLPRYLRESGIPEEFIQAEVPASKWEYVLGIFEALHDGGSAARRALRQFIGGWLEGRYHAPPRTEVRKRIVALLAAQGWHVREGRLVIGERTADMAGTLTPVGQDARIAALHADVRQAADRYLESGHPEVAIFEVFKAVNNRVKRMTGLDVDGAALMGEAFKDSNPPLALADLSTETGRNIQAGFRFLFMGAVRGIRNPDAHELFKVLDAEEALETLAFASMLMRRLDSADQTRGQT
ncbi:MAG: TIGR02391 family protein [Solirubrobacteraceae bacterium]